MSALRYQLIVYSLTFLTLCGIANCATPINGATGVEQSNGISTTSIEKFRILGVFSHPGKSHFDVFRPLLEELARRGHDVTVVSYFPRDNRTEPMSNYRDINLVSEDNDVFVNVVDLNMINHSPISMILELMMLRSWGIHCCTLGLQNPGVQKLINSNEKFDLIITEGFNSDCFLGFVHRFKAPFISLSSHQLMPWMNQRFANEDNPSYIPSIFNGFAPSMSFGERIINSLTLQFIKVFYEYRFNRPIQKLVEEAFGPGVPPLREIAKNTSVVLVNTHYSLHGAKPDLPSIVEVGGLHISPTHKPLPIELQRFLDEARDGVLFFSLGSMIKASSMPKEKLAAVMKVIGSIPRKVIWKWETEDMPNKPSNLMILKWLPQAAILSKLPCLPFLRP